MAAFSQKQQRGNLEGTGKAPQGAVFTRRMHKVGEQRAAPAAGVEEAQAADGHEQTSSSDALLKE